MKRIILSFVLILASGGMLQAQYNYVNLRLESKPTVVVSKYTYGNLRLYPIRANNSFHDFSRGVSRYVSLEEALQKGKVSVTEKGRGGTVNTLVMENISGDTVIVLSGEVVQGGKQDRVVSQDIILYPKSGKKDISVFCVEHGRWNAQRGDTSFKEYFSISSSEVRKAATVKKDQQEVWDKVSETTSKNNARTSSGTLAALQRSTSLTTDLKKYKDHFENTLSNETDVIGVVAVSGNTILGCDMFATHGIFTKYLPSLLNSYATEAITSGATVTIAYEKVKEYLDSIMADESKQDEQIEKNGSILKDGKKKIHISSF